MKVSQKNNLVPKKNVILVAFEICIYRKVPGKGAGGEASQAKEADQSHILFLWGFAPYFQQQQLSFHGSFPHTLALDAQLKIWLL